MHQTQSSQRTHTCKSFLSSATDPSLFFSIQAFGASLPEENAGIVSMHSNDKGTAADPSVLFAEYFSEKGLDVFLERWESINDPTNLSLSIESPVKIESKQSLLITHEGGRATGSLLYRRLPSRLQQVFARWYVCIDSDCWPIHHFGTHPGGGRNF